MFDMQFSADGIAHLKRDEALKLKAYLCPAGRPTIGYGHTLGVALGQVITEADAELFLRMDLDPCVAVINRLVKVPLTQNQFDALVIFIFNVGIPAFTTSTLLKVLNNGDYALVPAQLMRWTKCIDQITGKLVDSQGLYNRRCSEVALWGKV